MDSKKKMLNSVAEGEKEKDKEVKIDEGNAKLIEWEDYQQELARFCSLTSALNEAKQKKLVLQQKLQSLIQVEAESLNRSNELDEMREKLESRKLVMGNMSMHSKVAEEKVKKQEEQLSSEIRSLLLAGTALSVASKQLQEANGYLAGERGYLHLKTLQKSLRVRQQYMVSQVSLLYPVKFVIGHPHEQELESFTSSIKSGLHLTVIPFTKMSFFTDKKEVQQSSTALGYIAHAVLLIASYLQVPLRYPLRLGGSRSYIRDYAPSIEPVSSDETSNSLVLTNAKPVEFPLFLEGQDSTRAAYAVFLLNKLLEWLQKSPVYKHVYAFLFLWEMHAIQKCYAFPQLFPPLLNNSCKLDFIFLFQSYIIKRNDLM
ncbi:UV radiation resistance-associated gene protein isoform X2 [Coffea eugenioides]|uniref:UV radiation resistance-associated gene protein isoform X2 n=1 Tax=Coffea eugenioides TaxID=49369 RepID=UPI000F60621A|nr:UV radiation resistance-associated gene protein isoform X2 [Coffea eugenioides]